MKKVNTETLLIIFSTLGCCLFDSKPPGEVNNLLAVAGNRYVALSWQNPVDSDFDHVDIWFGTETANTEFNGIKDPEGSAIVGLTNEIEYTFIIKTVDKKGNTSSGTTVLATPKTEDQEPNALIFRSVGISTNALCVGQNSFTLTITGDMAEFSTPLPLNIGVGDVLIYDHNPEGINDKIAFIYKRISSSVYTLKNVTGGNPAPTSGTTAEWAIYRAYTSLADAEDGRENPSIPEAMREFDDGNRDISANSEIWQFACYADGVETIPVIWNGWNTDNVHYVRVFTPYLSTEVGISQRHKGVWSNTAYHIIASNATALQFINCDVHLEGLQMMLNSVNSESQRAIYITGSDETKEIYLLKNIFKGAGPVSYNYHNAVAVTGAGNGELFAWNNIIYNFTNIDNSTAGFYLNSNNFRCYIYNNTIQNCSVGIYNNTGKTISRNNLCQDCTDGWRGTYDPFSDFNLSDLPADAPGVNSKNSTVVAFINKGNADFHLAANDIAARFAGTNCSEDEKLAFSDDIDSDSRTGWSIGADEAE